MSTQNTFHPANHHGWPDLEDRSQLHNRANSRALKTALQQAHVRAIEIAVERELFLGQVAALADLPKRLAERLLRPGILKAGQQPWGTGPATPSRHALKRSRSPRPRQELSPP